MDFALCHPPSEPRVFIEVKAVGQITGAEKQLFEYAFHRKIPIAILTDGREWRFFYPGRQGDYTERRAYTLDLSETDNEEGAKRLNRYLNYKSICNDKAVRAIKYDYRNISKERKIKKGLLEAWIKLVEDADQCLIDVVARKTEILCRYKPTRKQVLDFLKSRERENSYPAEVSFPLSPRRTNKGSRGHLVVTMPTGEKIDHDIGADTFVEVIEKLGMEKVKNLGDKATRSPIILTSKSDNVNLNPRKSGRYYIRTRGTVEWKKKILEKIASELGVRLQIEIVSKD